MERFPPGMQRFLRVYFAYVAYFAAVVIGMGVASVAGVIALLLFGRNDWIDTGVALVVFAAVIVPLIRAARFVLRGFGASRPKYRDPPMP